MGRAGMQSAGISVTLVLLAFALCFPGSGQGAPQGSWSAPRGFGFDGRGPEVVMSGSSANVLLRTEGGLVSSRLGHKSGSFGSPPLPVSSGPVPGLWASLVALGNGSLFAAWVSTDGSIRFSTQRSPGESWSTEKLVSAPVPEVPGSFSVVAAGRTDVCIAWLHDSIVLSCGNPSTGLGEPRLVPGSGPQSGGFSLAASPGGQVILAWTKFANSVPSTRAVTWRSGEEPGRSHNLGVGFSPSAAIGRGGKAVVGWTATEGTGSPAKQIARVAVRSSLAARWKRARIRNSGSKEVVGALVERDGDPGLLIWDDGSNPVDPGTGLPPRNLYYSSIDSKLLGNMALISKRGADVSQKPSIHQGPDETINVAWNESTNPGVFVATKLPGEAFRKPVTIGSDDSMFPRIATGDNGNAVVTWTATSGLTGPTVAKFSVARPDTAYCRREPFRVLSQKRTKRGLFNLKLKANQTGRVKVIIPGSKPVLANLVRGQTTQVRAQPETSRRSSIVRLRFTSGFGCRAFQKSLNLRAKEWT